jgi:multidrug efflux pump
LFTEAEQFENIILRADDQGAAITRIKNIGRADLGRKDYSIRSKYQGKDATLIVVYQQPGANALDVANQVYATMENLSKSFPDGLKYEMALDEFPRRVEVRNGAGYHKIREGLHRRSRAHVL